MVLEKGIVELWFFVCLFAYLYFLRGESLNLSIRKKTDFVLEKIKQWKKTWTPCDPIK